MSSSSTEEEQCLVSTPPDILFEAQNANESLLPVKSKEKYLAAYQTFLEWKRSKNAHSFSQNVFLAYFNELSNKYRPSSLWCIYSMLKSIMKTKHNIDMKAYCNLMAFLKRRSDGYVGRKSKVLSSTDVEKILKEAPDSQYLATKVALIFGITGACRRQGLNDITTKDIENHGEMLLVKIPNTKNKIPRSFTIFYELVRKYQALRSPKAKTDRFFQNFQKGKCTAQPIGINKFGAMPREIAKYLDLPDADSYTGHSFRRTSATLLADSGADILTLKRHGGWRSDAVAESYVEDSMHSKANISAKITREINLEPQTKKFCPEPQASTSRDTGYLPPASTHYVCREPRPSTSRDTGYLPPAPTYDDRPQIHIQRSRNSNENISLSPTFTQENENSDVINNTNNIMQTLKMPTKSVSYHFENCTFTNCFNN